MTTHNGILTPAQIETLRAVPTGHALDAQGTAQDIAEALEALEASRNAAQGHPDSDALGAALAACDALPRAGGLMVRPRPYICRVCGQVELFSTNHTGPHYSACSACSWRGGRDDSGRWYNAQDKGRPHVYAGQNPRGTGEENPHARFARAPDPAPEAEALPVPGDTLGNGTVVLETAQTGARAYVLAFTGKGRAHPFAVWRLEIASRESADVPPSWGTYSGDYFARLGDALEGLKARTRGTVAA
jgi:hypothetical protein